MGDKKEPYAHYRQLDGGTFTTNTFARVEDFQRTFRPIPFMNSFSLILGAAAALPNLIANYVSHRPLQAGAHRTIGLCCTGYAVGYYLARFRMTSRMGKMKYAIDYIEEHKDKFPPKEPKRYSDPSVLYHWKPQR